ncbi:MAG: DUF6073 family protein [Candidatus Sulfotelmatobacter sp.]
MPKISDWGHRLRSDQLKDLFAPTEIKPFTATTGGIDNLALSSIDTFSIPGKGEFEVNFEGYFRVARSSPTSSNWGEAEWYVNMIELGLTGNAPGLGEMKVRLNEDAVSPGQVFASGAQAAAKACRIATAAVFHASSMGLELFNKEPILLMNDAIKSVPPVEDPNGEAHIYRLPLFNVKEPDGNAAAYLTRLRYTVGNYITQHQLTALQKRVGPR